MYFSIHSTAHITQAHLVSHFHCLLFYPGTLSLFSSAITHPHPHPHAHPHPHRHLHPHPGGCFSGQSFFKPHSCACNDTGGYYCSQMSLSVSRVTFASIFGDKTLISSSLSPLTTSRGRWGSRWKVEQLLLRDGWKNTIISSELRSYDSQSTIWAGQKYR